MKVRALYVFKKGTSSVRRDQNHFLLFSFDLAFNSLKVQWDIPPWVRVEGPPAGLMHVRDPSF